MNTISQITSTYSKKIDYLDIEIIIANSLAKTREFVLANPQYALTKSQYEKISILLERRLKREPIAYIVKHKEFYGMDFIVNSSTLIPRPETESMVEEALSSVIISHQSSTSITIIDVGTGSGCIIIAIANNDTKYGTHNTKYYATDISTEALKVAKKNARLNGVGEKIKFLHGDLLAPLLKTRSAKRHSHILENPGMSSLIITANLPYLSKEIYQGAPADVKKYEPKSALYSAEAGLAHYRKLLTQVKALSIDDDGLLMTMLLEISPEQKMPITKLIKSILPASKIYFTKDLAGKWRLCKITI